MFTITNDLELFGILENAMGERASESTVMNLKKTMFGECSAPFPTIEISAAALKTSCKQMLRANTHYIGAYTPAQPSSDSPEKNLPLSFVLPEEQLL